VRFEKGEINKMIKRYWKHVFLTSHFSSPNSQGGQALITLLFFVIITVTITSGAVVIILINSLSQTKLQESSLAYEVAQSGIEEAQLRLLRDPNYTGETIQTSASTMTIQRTGTNPYVFLATGTVGNLVRKIQITLQYQAGAYQVTSQKEIF
jgi:hypothetical protein